MNVLLITLSRRFLSDLQAAARLVPLPDNAALPFPFPFSRANSIGSTFPPFMQDMGSTPLTIDSPDTLRNTLERTLSGAGSGSQPGRNANPNAVDPATLVDTWNEVCIFFFFFILF